MTELWSFSLDCSDELLTAAEALVSFDELERAQKFRFARHRRRFLIRRAMRRIIVANCLQIPVGDLSIAEGKFGKPVIPGAEDDFAFNASHAGDCGVVVTGAGRLGVDVEDVRREMDFKQFAERKFTAEEFAEISQHEGRALAQVFFNCWTGKEAYVKALGDGLQKDLQSFSVRCAPMQGPGLIWDQQDAATPDNWRFRRFSTGPYIVSIADDSPRLSEEIAVNELQLSLTLQNSIVNNVGESKWRES